MAHNKYLCNRSGRNYENYRKIRNKCSNLSREALKQYFNKNCSESKEKPKHFWKVVKPYFSRKNKTSENFQLEINNKIVSDPMVIAEHFNNFYLNIANSIGNNSNFAETIEHHPSYRVITDHVKENNIPHFDFKTIDRESVIDLIDRLPSGKAPGYDNITGHCVKTAKHVICDPLHCLINRMFAESVFPGPLKHADITPIYKKKQQIT